METTKIQTIEKVPRLMLLRKVLLICGILSSLLYVAADILAAMQWQGYSYTSQSVSELMAVGAPTRPLIVLFFTIYNMLMMAFGLGIWLTTVRKRSQRLIGIVLIVYGILGLAALLFFPMHLRGDEKTITDAMHIVFTGILVLFIFLSVGLGAAAQGKRFRLYSIGTILVLLLFGVLAGMDGPKIAAQLPTPWLGIKERINIYGYLLWVIVYAVILFRREKELN